MFVQKDESMEERGLELLAPAGSLESLKAAVQAGADAVYMGGTRFGARAYAENPGGEALLEAIDYAHLYGVKLYLTVNTLLKEAEPESLHLAPVTTPVTRLDEVEAARHPVLKYEFEE